MLELRTGGGIGYAPRRGCLEETQHTLYKQSSECLTESPCIRMPSFGLGNLLHTHLVAGYSMAALQTVWEGQGTGVGRGGGEVREGRRVRVWIRVRARARV